VPRYGHAVLGGTFDHLHIGHEALLERAFRVGVRVSIGLTTESFLREHPKPSDDRLQGYATRRRALARWIRRHHPERPARIVPLSNPFGRSVEAGVDVLVVSEDTRAGARAVNRERRRLGRLPLPLEIVPLVLGDDLLPVSSRRIRGGEIDRNGRRRSPIRVGLAASHADDLAVLRRAARRAFATFVPCGSIRGAPAARGRNRGDARSLAARAVHNCDLGIGLVRRHGGGWELVERTPMFELPPRLVRGAQPRVLYEATLRQLRPDLGG
jgi:pantetheine-phosphate adenylyltransferase